MGLGCIGAFAGLAIGAAGAAPASGRSQMPHKMLLRAGMGFLGTIASTAVKTVGLKSFAETANEKHMGPWADMCKAAGILNTPLTPYIDADLLGHTHLAVDGSAICATGFRYAVPQLTADTLRAQVEMYVAQQLFPATALRK